MSGPVQQALTAQRGDTFKKQNGLSGITSDQIAEAWFTVKLGDIQNSPDDVNAVTQVTLTGGGIAIVDPRTLLITVPADKTALWTSGLYSYDLAIRTLAGEDYTLTQGPLVVSFDVTRTL